MQFHRGDVSDRADAAEQPVCEQLESRLLLSASIRRAVLRVSGGSDGDDISVSLTKTKIVVITNGHQQTFNSTGVKSARIDGGAGEDWISLTGKLPALIIGGAGDDTIIAGSSADFLDGGDGND